MTAEWIQAGYIQAGYKDAYYGLVVKCTPQTYVFE